MRLGQQLILLIVAALLSCHSLRAATINVPADQATINGAIGVAAASDSIIVAAGTYNEDVNVSKTVIIQLNGNISILSLTGIAGSTVNIQANTLTVSGTTSTTYSGQITGTGKLIKGGTSTLTLSGDNSFGSVDANEGILAVAPTGTTALGTLKIASATAGTLRVDSGTVTAAAVQDGGVSSLVIGNGAMTVANGICSPSRNDRRKSVLNRQSKSSSPSVSGVAPDRGLYAGGCT